MVRTRNPATGQIFDDGVAQVVVANSLLSYVWTGAGTTSAPSATALADFVVGANSDGAATGLTYHVIDGAWVATGATVKNLYGGA
jgi:hypothetical protein